MADCYFHGFRLRIKEFREIGACASFCCRHANIVHPKSYFCAEITIQVSYTLNQSVWQPSLELGVVGRGCMYELLDLFSELKDIHYLTARRGARDNALQGRRPAAPPPIKILKMSEQL